MRRSDFDHLLRKAGTVASDRHFIVFGSQAIWGLLTKVPKALAASLEADLYPKTYPHAVPLIVEALGRRSRFYRTHGYYADCVAPELATFPNGWETRLVPYANEKTGGVTGWCVEVHDLAISKLIAGREKDFAYITVLLKHKLVQHELFAGAPGSITDRGTTED